MLFPTTPASPLPLLRLCRRQCRYHSRPPSPRYHCSESGGALGASRKGGGCRPPPPSSRPSSSSRGGPPSPSIVVRRRGIGFLHEDAARSRRRRWFGDSANTNGSNPGSPNPTLLGGFLSPKPMPPRGTPQMVRRDGIAVRGVRHHGHVDDVSGEAGGRRRPGPAGHHEGR